jgi:hypothetical protein
MHTRTHAHTQHAHADAHAHTHTQHAHKHTHSTQHAHTLTHKRTHTNARTHSTPHTPRDEVDNANGPALCLKPLERALGFDLKQTNSTPRKTRRSNHPAHIGSGPWAHPCRTGRMRAEGKPGGGRWCGRRRSDAEAEAEANEGGGRGGG